MKVLLVCLSLLGSPFVHSAGFVLSLDNCARWLETGSANEERHAMWRSSSLTESILSREDALGMVEQIFNSSNSRKKSIFRSEVDRASNDYGDGLFQANLRLALLHIFGSTKDRPSFTGGATNEIVLNQYLRAPSPEEKQRALRAAFAQLPENGRLVLVANVRDRKRDKKSQLLGFVRAAVTDVFTHRRKITNFDLAIFSTFCVELAEDAEFLTDTSKDVLKQIAEAGFVVLQVEKERHGFAIGIVAQKPDPNINPYCAADGEELTRLFSHNQVTGLEINCWSMTRGRYNDYDGQFFVLKDSEKRISGTLGIHREFARGVLEYFRLGAEQLTNGQGKKLLEQALSFARVKEYASVQIALSDTQGALIVLLEANGFKREGETNKYTLQLNP